MTLSLRASLLLGCSLLSLVIGCGPGDSTSSAGSSSLDAEPKLARTGGTFDKLTITPVDAVAYVTPVTDGSNGVKSRLIIVAGDRADLCSGGPMHAGDTVFFIDALSGDATFQPGTFTQKMDTVPGQVDTGASKIGPKCAANGQDYGASEATVVVSKITATEVAGTFDMAFPNGDGTLKGTFNVPICNQPYKPCE